MKALSVSLNFNPGHFSHLVASYRLFEELGYQSEMLLAPEFEIMDPTDQFEKIYTIGKKKVDYAIFWFPSLKNILAIRKLKATGCKIIYVFHEPFDSFSEYRKGGFGWLKIAKISIINFVNILTLKLASSVILPSRRAVEIYSKNYKKFNNNFYHIPLLFDDECGDYLAVSNKKYISYIGTVAEDHAFDKFIDFVIYALKNNKFSYFRFLIATKSEISTEILDRLSDSRVEILAGKPLTNEEINLCYAESAVVWNAYNRSMQSGVLPKAFMFGTPAITGSNIENENYSNHYNGISVRNNGDFDELTTAIITILNDLERFSSNARQTFLNKFYFKNYIAEFEDILNK